MSNKTEKKNIVTYEEQIAMGLIRKKDPFVAPAKTGEILPPVRRVEPVPGHQAQVNYNVTPTATQHILVKTSATDRAQAFNISIKSLSTVVGGAAVLVAIWWGDIPLLSLPAVVVFVLTFAICWVIGYRQSLLHSAEGVSLFEARNKWKVIQYDVKKRWQAYDREHKQALQERREDRRNMKKGK